MSDGFIRLPADSVGKKLRTWELPDGTHAEAVVIVDADGNLISSPESPQSSALTALTLAPGISANLDADDIATGTVGHLVMVRVASSVPIRADIQTAAGVTITSRDHLFTSYGRLTEIWTPPQGGFVRLTGGSNQRFRIVVTNLSTTETVDVYTTAYWDEKTT